jgi:hypothetical protein
VGAGGDLGDISDQENMTGVKATDMCLGYGQNLKKFKISIRCTESRLWFHKECAGISSEVLGGAKTNTGLA